MSNFLSFLCSASAHIHLCRVILCSVFTILNAVYNASAVAANVFLGLGSPTLLSILGSRMFLNLKEAGEHGVNAGTDWSSHCISTIGFDEPLTPNDE